MRTWIAVLCLVLAPLGAQAQQPNRLVGTWKLVSNTLDPAGRKSETLGRNPHGTLIFTADGHYTLFMSRAGLPRFDGNNRERGTDDENRAIVRGTIAHSGRYTVDEAAGSFAWRVEFSTFPNWNNTTQTRKFTLDGDQLRYTNPSASGAPDKPLQAVWRRAK